MNHRRGAAMSDGENRLEPALIDVVDVPPGSYAKETPHG